MKNHKNIKVLFLDVDGTMTDGKIHISQEGELFKSFSVKDGYAINHILAEKGIVPIVITGRESSIVQIRCREIGITELYQGISDKREKMMEIMERIGVSLMECSYMGDDLNDYECMNMVSLRGCPKDAAREIIEISDFVSNRCGGEGAVREFVEWL